MKILLSIKPEYSEKIFSGSKRYEFRKQKPKLIVDRVFMYESHPSKIIVGWFTIKRVLQGTPKNIWDKCNKNGGIERRKYFTYCNGNKNIYAFEIDKVYRFEFPIDPYKIHSGFKPPQNFLYLSDSSIIDNIGDWG